MAASTTVMCYNGRHWFVAHSLMITALFSSWSRRDVFHFCTSGLGSVVGSMMMCHSVADLTGQLRKIISGRANTEKGFGLEKRNLMACQWARDAFAFGSVRVTSLAWEGGRVTLSGCLWFPAVPLYVPSWVKLSTCSRIFNWKHRFPQGIFVLIVMVLSYRDATRTVS